MNDAHQPRNGKHRPRPAALRDPATVNDHPFVPRREWWTTCDTCGLAQAAHATTTLTPGDQRA